MDADHASACEPWPIGSERRVRVSTAIRSDDQRRNHPEHRSEPDIQRIVVPAHDRATRDRRGDDEQADSGRLRKR